MPRRGATAAGFFIGVLRMLGIHELQVFVAAAETENFSAAARKLQLSQPAISFQIQSLEQQLKVQLFQRIGRRISLTEAGRDLRRRPRRSRKSCIQRRRAGTFARPLRPPSLRGPCRWVARTFFRQGGNHPSKLGRKSVRVAKPQEVSCTCTSCRCAKSDTFFDTIE